MHDRVDSPAVGARVFRSRDRDGGRRVVDSGTVAEIPERQPAFREVVYSAAHDAARMPAAQPHPRTVH